MNQKLRGIKMVFFDAGGTLLNLDAERICGHLLATLRIETDVAQYHRAQCVAMFEISKIVGTGKHSTENVRKEFFTILKRELGVDDGSIEQAVEETIKLSQAEMLWHSTDPANREVLLKLRERGFRLAIVSNSDGRVAEGFDSAGLGDLFEFVIDSFVVGVEKPAPRIFQIALKKARIDASEAVYVGDLYSVDVIGARAVGLTPILYDPYDLNSDKDCLRVRDLADLLDVLA